MSRSTRRLARASEWMEAAACRNEPMGTFFPQSGSRPEVARALAFCARCPVITQCRQAGKVNRYGVWGGGLYVGEPGRWYSPEEVSRWLAHPGRPAITA